MPIWNGRELFSGATTVERNRLGPGLHQQQSSSAVSPSRDDETADETKLVVAAAGVSCSHDSKVTLDLVESGQSSCGGGDDQRQLTNSKKFAVMADEPLTAQVMLITEDNPVNSAITTTTTAAATSPATSKSYLRRLGDYLNRRRLKSFSAEDPPEEQQHQHQKRKEGEELSNVIFGDNVVVDKVLEKKSKQGNFVIRADDGPITSSSSTTQDLTSDISDVEMDVRVGVDAEEGIGAKAPKASSGYLLPRVFLNKEG